MKAKREMKDFFNKPIFKKEFYTKENLKNVWNDIKLFCSENKKYVAVVGILVVLIIVLIIIASGSKKGKTDSTEASTQLSVEEFEFDDSYTEESKDLIATLLSDYYTAYCADDLETLDTLAYPMTDNEKSYIGVVSQYYESVGDITAYAKSGLEEGSFFVSVENTIKFYGVDTVAPTLDFFYIETDAEGNLYISNAYSNFNMTYQETTLDDDVLELISKYIDDSEFADLQSSVQQKYDEAIASDENLKTMLETTLSGAIKQWYSTARVDLSSEGTESTEDTTEQATETENTDQTTDDENTDGQTTDGENTDGQTTDETQNTDNTADQTAEETTPAEYSVVTKDIVNVRDGASETANKLGMLKDGITLTAYGTEGDWTIVSYSAGANGRAYIKTDNLETVNQ